MTNCHKYKELPSKKNIYQICWSQWRINIETGATKNVFIYCICDKYIFATYLGYSFIGSPHLWHKITRHTPWNEIEIQLSITTIVFIFFDSYIGTRYPYNIRDTLALNAEKHRAIEKNRRDV